VCVGSPERFGELVVQGLGTLQLWGLLLQAALEYGSAYLLQRWLLTRMAEERRARAWNALTWSTAIFWAGGLSMLPFCWVTRDTRGPLAGALALFYGAVWTAVLVGVSMAGGELIARAFQLAPAHG
jgi:hypothetical protein